MIGKDSLYTGKERCIWMCSVDSPDHRQRTQVVHEAWQGVTGNDHAEFSTWKFSIFV